MITLKNCEVFRVTFKCRKICQHSLLLRNRGFFLWIFPSKKWTYVNEIILEISSFLYFNCTSFTCVYLSKTVKTCCTVLLRQTIDKIKVFICSIYNTFKLYKTNDNYRIWIHETADFKKKKSLMRGKNAQINMSEQTRTYILIKF